LCLAFTPGSFSLSLRFRLALKLPRQAGFSTSSIPTNLEQRPWPKHKTNPTSQIKNQNRDPIISPRRQTAIYKLQIGFIEV
jgi:hypothetical protein